MEPTTIALILLLVFGGVEHVQKEKAHDKIEMLEASLQKAEENLQTTIEVNETNASTITEIDNARIKCVADLEETRAKQADFAALNEGNKFRIKELEKLVDSFEWSSVRIPAELLDQITTD